MQTISNKKNFLRKFSRILISILLEVRVFYFVLSMPIDIQQYRGEIDAFCNNLSCFKYARSNHHSVNPLSANPTTWLSVFDHFVELALKGLK